MSFALHGIGISDGIAIGRAHLLSHAFFEVNHYEIDLGGIKDEQKRFVQAIETTRIELKQLRDKIPVGAPSELEAFISLHLMILGDEILSEYPKKQIATLLCNAEWALKLQLDRLLEKFDEIEDDYLRDRKSDITQVAERILRNLVGEKSKPDLLEENGQIIIVAHDMSPTDILQFKENRFGSFITDVGGTTSHTAIIARSLNVPSIVALHQARKLIREGEKLIVDGNKGVVIVSPHEILIKEYEKKKLEISRRKKKLKRLKTRDTVTGDGTPISLMANIELPNDTYQALDNGASGIGLFRTEFLYLDRGDLPLEDEQYIAYKDAVKAFSGKPVVVRTFDLGADKYTPHSKQPVGDNPALGLRAIRLCLAEPAMFHDQLKAILRASDHGNIKILVPMLTNLQEIHQTLSLINKAKKSLSDGGHSFNEKIEIGCMIEVPGAALAIDIFAEYFDFFSIGTNDLIQYTLAIDRNDDSVSHLYNPLHPAVVHMLARVIKIGDMLNKPVAICGEMAGDPKLTRFLLGLGLRQFSMHPANLLQVKEIVLSTDINQTIPMVSKLTDPRTTESEREQILDSLNATS